MVRPGEGGWGEIGANEKGVTVYDRNPLKSDAALGRLKHLFQHTGGTMIGDCTSDLLDALQKEIEHAQEQARHAWVAMDVALEGARNLSRLVVIPKGTKDWPSKEVHHG